MTKNHAGKIIAGTLTALVSALLALTLLGILPWATKAEVKEFKGEVQESLKRIDRRVDDLHQLFIPRRRE